MPTTISSLPPELLGHIFDLGAVSLSISELVERPRMDPAAMQERYAFLRSMALVGRDWTSLAQSLLAQEVQLSSERAAKRFLSWILEREVITTKLVLLDGVKRQTATAILRASKGLRELVMGSTGIDASVLCLPNLSDLTSLGLNCDSLECTSEATLQPNFQLRHFTLSYGASFPTSFLSVVLQLTLTSLRLPLPFKLSSLTTSQYDLDIEKHVVRHLCAMGPNLLSLTILGLDQSRLLAPFFQRCDHLHHFGSTLDSIRSYLKLLPALLECSILVESRLDAKAVESLLTRPELLPSTAASRLRQLSLLISRGHTYKEKLMASFVRPRGPGDVGWVLQPLRVHRPTKFWTFCDENNIELVVRCVD